MCCCGRRRGVGTRACGCVSVGVGVFFFVFVFLLFFGQKKLNFDFLAFSNYFLVLTRKLKTPN